jgi:hypothetical protein
MHIIANLALKRLDIRAINEDTDKFSRFQGKA